MRPGPSPPARTQAGESSVSRSNAARACAGPHAGG